MSAIGLEVAGLLVGRPTGVGLYGREVLTALAARKTYEYLLVYPWGRWRRRRFLPSLGLPYVAYASGGRLVRRVQLLHTLDTRFPSAYNGLLVSTLFDVISALPISAELGWSTAEFRAKKLRAYREITARASVIITISEASAADIREHLEPPGDVVVIPPGVRRLPSAGEEADRRAVAAVGVEGRYVLCVGALCPRKNLGAVVHAFERVRGASPPTQLVIVGAPAYGWDGSAAERALDRLRRGTGRVVVLGYVDDALLWSLYRQAAVCLHLAHYEGFGLPVLEAQAAGTPVVASRRGGLLDAGGDAAWWVDPEDSENAAMVVSDVLRGGSEVERRVALGLARADQFSWDRTVEAIEGVYRRVLASR